MACDIGEWLEGLGLGKYTETFAENDVDFRALPHLDREDLKELGVSLGHRKVILAAISELRSSDDVKPGSEVATSPVEMGEELSASSGQTPVEAHEMALRLKPFDLYWLEEPIFPPENFAALADLQRRAGIPLAAGENASTAFEFRAMFAAGAVTFGQPDVIKVGGITEFLKIAALAETSNVTLMPHSPHFATGWLATLQLMAALPDTGLIERLYVTPEASLYGDLIEPVKGQFRLPEGPGLGPDPDPDVIKTYTVRGD